MKKRGYQLEICQKVAEGHWKYSSDHRILLVTVEGGKNIPKPIQ